MKPRVLVCVLCGSNERTDWINPQLCAGLLRLQLDPRFEITFVMGRDLRPVEHSRNACIVDARARGVSACVQIDNDMVLPAGFGDILNDALSSGKAAVALSSGVLEGAQIIPGDRGPRDGDFRQTGCAGAGVLIVSSEVWRVIPRGPYFRWLTNDDEVLSRKLGEDYFFSELLYQHGLKLWTHDRLAGHLKTVDVTQMIRNLEQAAR